MVKYLLFTIFLLFNIGLKSQNITSRLSLQSGGNVYFSFNSLEKYNNGISYNDWTKVKVYFVDTTNLGVQNSTKWKLSVRSTRDKIYGDGGNDLPLSTIEFTTNSNDGGVVYNNPTILQDINTILISNGSQTVDVVAGTSWLTDVFISYHCGTNVANKLLGKPPDYYTVDLVFTLEAE